MDCGDSRALAISFFSSKANTKLVYPDPGLRPSEFVRTIVQLAETEYDAVLPVSYESCVSLARLAPNLTKAMLPTIESMEIASDKGKTTKLAAELKVPTPKTIAVSDMQSLEQAARSLGFPFFLKNTLGSGQNLVIHSEPEMRGVANKLFSSWGQNLIAQERLTGDGYGFFALFNHGSLRAYFMHRRIREAYENGGPSTCAESCFDPMLKQYGIRILQTLNWHGVAMAEFKRAKDGEYKLLEINPKFWGSLDLAIAAGVNFPELVVECITKGDCKMVDEYSRNVRFQWPIPDDLLRLAWGGYGMKGVIRDLANPRVKKNLTIHDPGPALIQLIELGYLFGRTVRNRGRFV